MSGAGALGDFSMLELFRMDAEVQLATLTDGLLSLEQGSASTETLDAMMRAAHSIKGAARVIDLGSAVTLAHAMEDCFVAAQHGTVTLQSARIDILLGAVDTLNTISMLQQDDVDSWFAGHQSEIDAMVIALTAISHDQSVAVENDSETEAIAPLPDAGAEQPEQQLVEEGAAPRQTVRITSEQIDEIFDLAGELQVKWQWLGHFSTALLQMKRQMSEVEWDLSSLHRQVGSGGSDVHVTRDIERIQRKAVEFNRQFSNQLSEMEQHERSIYTLSRRLHHQSVASRMSPFSDAVHGLPRLIRDLGKALGKQVRLEIRGENTLVDRDILERIRAPLNHLVRNAIDHGLEASEERIRTGKTGESLLRIEARHHAGMLNITVSDDGRGADIEGLRHAIVEKGMTTAEMAGKMQQEELMEFLFLPKFSMRHEVNEISGRGVGLDVVATCMRDLRGTVQAVSTAGQGMHFELRLPITLSVMRALIIELAGESYGIPLTRIERALICQPDQIETIEGRHYLSEKHEHIGLISASRILGLKEPAPSKSALSVVVLSDGLLKYGVIVDRFLGEKNVIEKVLDPRLGKIRDIQSAGLMDDGSMLLVIDVKDMLISIDKIIQRGGLLANRARYAPASTAEHKRILIVDDSITVREVERKLLAAEGYEIDVAVDGADGWNSVRSGHYDLVLTDVDMPRMDGIELVRHIRNDAKLQAMPIVIISYKESEEDRMRGLEAGADAYLTKSSFHDDALIHMVVDLIGEAVS